MGDSRTSSSCTGTRAAQLAALLLGWFQLECRRLGALSPCRQPARPRAACSGRGLHVAQQWGQERRHQHPGCHLLARPGSGATGTLNLPPFCHLNFRFSA